MTFEAPLIRETCEACDGRGAYLETEKEHDAEGWWQRTVEHECPCCNGSGWIVTEVTTDGPATITSIRSTEPVAKQHERWAAGRARIAPWAGVPEGTS